MTQDLKDVHSWFGLTYAAYFVMQRRMLETMPLEWQDRFVTLMEELEETLDRKDVPHRFVVRARNEDGKFIKDPYANYKYPEKSIPLKDKTL